METKNIGVNNAIYDDYGNRWYTAQDDPVALLRAESVVKTKWTLDILDLLKNPHLRILDIGCGGGFLSNALARQGYKVTGVDLSKESLEVAKKYDITKSVKYIAADAFQLPFADESFDVVTAMDFLEHIEDPARAIKEFSRVIRPSGFFLFHTFNRNWLAGLIVIKMVEWFVRNTPPRMHILRLFIKPSELHTYCQNAGLNVRLMSGIRPIFSSLRWSSLFTGIVPLSLRFKLSRSLGLSYVGYAVKDR